MGYAILSALFLVAGWPLGLVIRWTMTRGKGAGNVGRARTTL